jgi:hypothetical protein
MRRSAEASRVLGFIASLIKLSIVRHLAYNVLAAAYAYALTPYLINVRNEMVLLSCQGFSLILMGSTHDLVRGLYRIVTNDGPPNFGDFFKAGANGVVVLVAMITTVFCYNFCPIMSFFWRHITVLTPFLAMGFCAGYVWFQLVEKPWEVLLEILAFSYHVLELCLHCLLALVVLVCRPANFIINTLSEGLLTTCRLFSRNAHEPRYTYKKLAHREIRLLRLVKKHPFAETTCELFHKSLEKKPKYEAISYTWGDPIPTCWVCVNGKWLSTTRNAQRVIQERGSIWRTRTIWIDSICINQNDEDERAKQLRLMNEIFRRASRVVVCLGSHPTARTARSFLMQMRLRLFWYVPDDMDLAKAAPRKGDHRWAALINLLAHPFWTRAWIIQEIAVAKHVHILYGGNYINWDDFVLVMRAFSNHGFGTILHLADLVHLDWMGRSVLTPGMASLLAAIRDNISQVPSIPLAELLIQFSCSKATEPRDKVYALLGMTDECATSELEPSYAESNTAENVYIRTARYLMAQKDPLCFLYLAGVGYTNTNYSLPSWVPDWKNPNMLTTFGSFQAAAKYHASGTSELTPPTVPVSDRISLRGIVCDTIRGMTPTCVNLSGGSNVPEILSLVSTWLQAANWLARYGARNPYRDGELLSEAFWRTLIGDNGRGTCPAPKEYGAYYDSLVKASNFARFINDMAARPDANPLAAQRILAESQRLAADDSVNLTRFYGPFGHACNGRRFAVTKKGYMALVPPRTKLGDQACIIFGLQTPFLLRSPEEVGNGKDLRASFKLVGECYIHGWMQGEMAPALFPDTLEIF